MSSTTTIRRYGCRRARTCSKPSPAKHGQFQLDLDEWEKVTRATDFV